MPRRYLIIAVLMFSFLTGYGQKVALVLSGGGSRGLAHIGVIRALEENQIPIDYIAGTSMGAIIAGFYAIGLSPDSMEKLVFSEEFINWSQGKINPKYQYYFKKLPPNASWVNIKFQYDSAFQSKIPTNIIASWPLDFAFLELFSAANVVSNHNFDSLFVPFRCVAADIESNSEYVFRKGDLRDAVRSSMTFPFYFKPIEVNGKLLFDGGMYNNFPSDVAYDDFFPDIIIGSKVVNKTKPPKVDDLFSQLENMVMGKTDYGVICDNSVLIAPQFEYANITDFRLAKEYIDSGYICALEKIDEIRLFVTDSIDKKIVDQRRKNFRDKMPPYLIDEIYFTNIDKNKAKYVKRHLSDGKGPIPMEKLKKEYFKLITDDKIEYIYPKLEYNPSSGYYDLYLDVTPEKNFNASFGGNVSSAANNEAFIGLQFKRLGSYGLNLSANTYLGRFYNSVKFDGRLDYPAFIPFHIDMALTYNQWNYYKTNASVFFTDTTPSYLLQKENHWKFNAVLPVGNKAKFETGITIATLKDDYYHSNVFSRIDTADRSDFRFVSPHILFELNSLNRKEFASTGGLLQAMLRYVNGTEKNYPGSTAIDPTEYEQPHDYFLARFKYVNYFLSKGIWHPAIFFESRFSTQKFFRNYTSSLLSASSFNPVPESRTLFLSNFRSYSYLAPGLVNVFLLKKNLDLRIDGYLFIPYKEIVKNTNLKADFSPAFDRYSFMGSASLVFHSPLGPVSLSLNYYERRDNPFSFIFNLGYIIFNRRAIE